MQVKLQLVVCTDKGREETVTDIVTLRKDGQRIEYLGLTLAEAQQLLTTIQPRVLERHIRGFLEDRSHSKACGAALNVKGSQTRRFRTRFDTFRLPSPRLDLCRCQRRKTTTFRPLTVLLDESVAPDLLFIETKWASLVSYDLSVEALTDFLLLEVTLDIQTVRHDTLTVAPRGEDELGEEPWAVIEGCPTDWGR
jgi:hypothetical protein